MINTAHGVVMGLTREVSLLVSCSQLGRIYLDMLNVYKVLSENISSAVAVNGTIPVAVAVKIGDVLCFNWKTALA